MISCWLSSHYSAARAERMNLQAALRARQNGNSAGILQAGKPGQQTLTAGRRLFAFRGLLRGLRFRHNAALKGTCQSQ